MARARGAEATGRVLQGRLAEEVSGALKRKAPSEARLAGVLRALAPVSPAVRDLLADTAATLARRGAFDRDLWCVAVRSLAEAGDPRAPAAVAAALASEGAGGLASLSAACFVSAASLATPLATTATCRQSHLALAAEVARLARGESQGGLLATLAPKIKESHRISLCVEVFVPLARAARLPKSAAPALAILRDAERHLGRWLVLAEVAVRAGDRAPVDEARTHSTEGAASSRAAWSLVAWALEPALPAPATRPTVELVSRLSDRPSADRDLAFLFRMAAARLPTARPMLESLVRGAALERETGLRAALHLARDHGDAGLRVAIARLAASDPLRELSGLATAALWDLGEREAASKAAVALAASRSLNAAAWGALVLAAAEGHLSGPVVTEATCRRLERGFLE